MGCYVSLAKPGKKICIGSLNKKIKIQVRSLTPKNNNTDYVEIFTDYISVWANLYVTRGQSLFDGVNLSNAFTHIFTIRYVANVVFTNFIDFEENKYKIEDVEDVDEEHKYLILRCKKLGDNTKENNFA